MAAPLIKAEATGLIINSGKLPNISIVIKDINLHNITVTIRPNSTYYLFNTSANNNAWFYNKGINL